MFAALERSEVSARATVLLSAIAFATWHISVVAFKTGFELPAPQIPIFLANALVLGIAWGTMRAMSGSIVVTSVSHGIWNGLAYVLFGEGTKSGALGIHDTATFGPEVGIIGLAVNAALAGLLWLQLRHPTLSNS